MPEGSEKEVKQNEIEIDYDDIPIETTKTSNKKSKKDPSLPDVKDDPRPEMKEGQDFRKVGNRKGKGTNTESFDPRSTIVGSDFDTYRITLVAHTHTHTHKQVRPSMRVIVGPNRETYGKPMKHDDIVVVPNFFCDKDDWTLYYQLIKEMRESQSQKEKRSEWIGWHENCHLITKNPNGSKTFKKILEKTSKYFETDFLPEATRCT